MYSEEDNYNYSKQQYGHYRDYEEQEEEDDYEESEDEDDFESEGQEEEDQDEDECEDESELEEEQLVVTRKRFEIVGHTYFHGNLVIRYVDPKTGEQKQMGTKNLLSSNELNYYQMNQVQKYANETTGFTPREQNTNAVTQDTIAIHSYTECNYNVYRKRQKRY